MKLWSVVGFAGLGMAILLGLNSCDSSDGTPDQGDQDIPENEISESEDLDSEEGELEPEGDPDETETGRPFDPFYIVPTDEIPVLRDFRTKRGLIHTHSPYSHDACDGAGFDEQGNRNEECLDQDRSGMCQTYQDFVFMTDHAAQFAEHEYPDVLLYREGDTLIERNSLPVANRIQCDTGHQVIFMAGTETEMMPIGLEHHLGSTVEERYANYGQATPELIELVHQAGGLGWLMHTEDWPIETILALPVDGFEMYNIHRNMMTSMAEAALLSLTMESHPEQVPERDIALIAIVEEDPDYMSKWAQAALVKKVVTSMATDAHQNVFNAAKDYSKRLDSFYRMMRWFSNYILVAGAEADTDDRTIKDAVREGRLYGGFDYLGYAIGFDFSALDAAGGNVIGEMGSVLDVSGATLHVVAPRLYGEVEEGSRPEIRVRLLKADADHWTEVASDAVEINYEAGPGVYRAEVRMVPYHLRPWLGTKGDDYLIEHVWIYSNPIWVGALAK